MFVRLYDYSSDHPSCVSNLVRALAPYGIDAGQIPTTFNIFMNVELAPSGQIKVLPPASIAGDFIRVRAEMDLIVGLTACSAELSNNWSFKPVAFEIAG
jgi:uncharacterized protein YcgI (DUF1989 family)